MRIEGSQPANNVGASAAASPEQTIAQAASLISSWLENGEIPSQTQINQICQALQQIPSSDPNSYEAQQTIQNLQMTPPDLSDAVSDIYSTPAADPLNIASLNPTQVALFMQGYASLAVYYNAQGDTASSDSALNSIQSFADYAYTTPGYLTGSQRDALAIVLADMSSGEPLNTVVSDMATFTSSVLG